MDRIPRDKRIVEHNDLVNARYDFSVLVHRLFIAGLLQIERDDESLKTYRIPVRELLLAFDMSTNVYSELKAMSPHLMRSATVGFEKQTKTGKRAFTLYPLFAKLSYQEGEGYVEISFNPELQQRLIQFKNNFTQYELRYVRHFTSQHSYRVYKWLKQVEDLRTDRTLSVDDMRLMLMLEDKYPNFAHFRQNVIEAAQRDLDEHADISFDYDLRRHGRKVTHVIFKIRLSRRMERHLIEIPGKPEQAPQLRLLNTAEEPDAFEHWLAALGPDERAGFDARVDALLARQQVKDGPARLVFWMMTARRLYESGEDT